jgi:heme/copper-type cytochrome/quinol oxidase subunit 2
MKSSVALIIAFILGVIAASVGWGDMLYTCLVFIGVIVMVVIGVMVWTCLDSRKSKVSDQVAAPGDKGATPR